MNNFEKINLVFAGRAINLDTLSGQDKLRFLAACIGERVKFVKSMYPSVPVPNFCFLLDQNFNACTKQIAGEYFVAINSGVVWILSEIFGSMLATRTTFPEYDSEDEIDIEKFYNPQVTNFENLSVQGVANTPINRDRQAAVRDMVTEAIVFLFMHEYGHILHGHVDYKQNLKGNSFISETVYDSSGQGMDSFESQTLEMDADSFATRISYKAIIASCKIHLGLKPEFPPFNEDFGRILYIWSFSVHTMLRLFGSRAPDTEALGRLRHPPSGLRASIIGSTITTIAHINGGEPFADFVAKNIARGAGYTEFCFQEISQLQLNKDAFKFSLTPEANTLRNIYRTEWMKLRPVLEKFAHKFIPEVTPDEITFHQHLKRT